jgi:pyruvate formate lyase activating enzyme
MEALFYEQLTAEKVKCTLCPHNCIIATGKKGFCGVRENKNGKLYSLVYGKPCSLAVDPIEKKPLYHFYPGEKVFSLATVGCNLDCAWCQNSSISKTQEIIAPYGTVSPKKIITLCTEAVCSIIAFTYTEPTVYYEYMLAIAKEAKKVGIRTVLVSNGYINEKALFTLLPYIDAANIDLKLFDEKKYLTWTKGKLAPVLDTLIRIKQAGVHLELTTLVVPDVNDDTKKAEEMYDWIVRHLGKDQIVHISRFYPCYKLTHKEPTPSPTMQAIATIAQKKLDYVYLGNMGEKSYAMCPNCGKKAIKKQCSCGCVIPGVFE